MTSAGIADLAGFRGRRFEEIMWQVLHRERAYNVKALDSPSTGKLRAWTLGAKEDASFTSLTQLLNNFAGTFDSALDFLSAGTKRLVEAASLYEARGRGEVEEEEGDDDEEEEEAVKATLPRVTNRLQQTMSGNKRVRNARADMSYDAVAPRVKRTRKETSSRHYNTGLLWLQYRNWDCFELYHIQIPELFTHCRHSRPKQGNGTAGIMEIYYAVLQHSTIGNAALACQTAGSCNTDSGHIFAFTTSIMRLKWNW